MFTTSTGCSHPDGHLITAEAFTGGMNGRVKTRIAILLVISMLLSGCTGGETEQEPEEIAGCMDQSAENYNPDATVSDRSCTYPEPEPEPEPKSAPETESEESPEATPAS